MICPDTIKGHQTEHDQPICKAMTGYDQGKRRLNVVVIHCKNALQPIVALVVYLSS